MAHAKGHCIMKSVLVTGGMGFIGNHLVHRLLQQGIEVTILDKSIHKPTYHANRQAKIIDGDILSTHLIRECLSKVDACFHLAAIASIEMSRRDWVFSHHNNVVGFNTLLQQIQDTPRKIKLVYASSSAVYGNCTQLPLSESYNTTPLSSYAADKFSNEAYAKALFHQFQIGSVGLRFFNVYGAGQHPSNPYTGVISKFRKAILDEKPLTIFGDGQQTRDFIHVDDVVDALICAAYHEQHQAEVYNVCSQQAVSINELAALMTQLTQHPHGIEYQPPRAGEVYHSQGNGAAIENAIGFKSKISLAVGMEQFLAAPLEGPQILEPNSSKKQKTQHFRV
jgi:UDP-glucose 4-epimerase